MTPQAAFTPQASDIVYELRVHFHQSTSISSIKISILNNGMHDSLEKRYHRPDFSEEMWISNVLVNSLKDRSDTFWKHRCV